MARFPGPFAAAGRRRTLRRLAFLRAWVLLQLYFAVVRHCRRREGLGDNPTVLQSGLPAAATPSEAAHHRGGEGQRGRPCAEAAGAH